MSVVFRTFFWLALATALSAQCVAHAASFETLYTFTGSDGGYPSARLVFGTRGALYGTTNGTIFRLGRRPATMTRLYTFTGGADGTDPSAGVVFGEQSALVGTALYGGANGGGTVFTFDRASKTLTTLHDFTSFADGMTPQGTPVFDKAGALYGITVYGGIAAVSSCSPYGCGTVFELDPSSGTFTKLHAFAGGFDGAYPVAGLVLDNQGALYGTTTYGGLVNGINCPSGCGAVFRFEPSTRTFTTLYAFTGGPDGAGPHAALVFDKQSVLYGTTAGGGIDNHGTVFKLDPANRTLTTLYTFAGLADGATPLAALVFDGQGALYGTTVYGGLATVNGCRPAGCGTVFKLDPSNGTLTTLHVFTGGIDGSHPLAGLVLGTQGALYGTTSQGGLHSGSGTVFKVIP